ncbi:MAG TPA: hypothetical protein VMJ10_33170 [Kofleriaceae bacterium]|nr:hypothetical protein [Kofleriaceae bacterium]
MRLLVVPLTVLAAAAHGAAAAPVDVAIDAPHELAAWDTADVKITIHNGGTQPIAVLAVELTSDAGTVAAWGHEGECKGNVRGCSIQSSWASEVAARRTASGGWELLVQGPPQQRQAPPTPAAREATERLLSVTAIAAGQSVVLTAPLTAMYQHGGKLDVALRYIAVDRVRWCAPAGEPPAGTFVPCQPVEPSAGYVLYAPATAIDAVAATARSHATFAIAHPAFDLDAARARGGVAAGAFGYARRTHRWILVDDAHGTTVVVGATDKPDALPGQWLEPLTALDQLGEVSVFWNTRDAAKAAAALRDARARGIAVDLFGFKGGTSRDRLIVALDPAHVAALAASLRALGYTMTPDGIAAAP